MSEDTTAKRASRRRRTTRGGRRRSLRAPGGLRESWPPAAETPSSQPPPRLDDDVGAFEVELDAEESAEFDGEIEDASEADCSALELESDGIDDTGATVEMYVQLPPPAPAIPEDEKTKPRYRLEDRFESFDVEPSNARDSESDELTNPRIRIAGLGMDGGESEVESNDVVVTRPSVVIAAARIIVDAPPSVSGTAPALRGGASSGETAPALRGGASSGETAPALRGGASSPPPAFDSTLVPGERPASFAPPSRPSTPPARDSLPAGVGSASTPPARPEIAALGAIASATSTLAGAVAPAAFPAPGAFPAPPVGAAPTHAFPAPPAGAVAVVPAPAPAEHERPPRESEPDLQLIDVEESEPPARPRDLRSPPPPPPERLRAAPPVPPAAPASAVPAGVPAKRPPPPPSAHKVEEDRQKRKQVRQWWERFFSDDYLVTVLPPTPAQIAKQVDFIETSLALSKGATVLDVGCGLGLQSIELARRGYLVVGLDLSLAMITRAAESAQQQNLKVSFVHADIREMEFDGAFDGVICMDTTFGFFDDEANRDVLARMHHALKPGGRMLLDVVNRDYVIKSQPNLVWFEGDECVCMEESEFNYFNSRLTVKRTMMREDGRQTNAEYSVRLYSLHELGQLVQQMGFRVIEVSGQEAVRGAFFGSHAPRILTLAERRTPGSRGSVVLPPERGSAEMARPSFAMAPERAGEANRPSAAFPPERTSTDAQKPGKPE